ncbi:MAG: hypothetical protein ACR2N4_09855 [Jatrophihabitans sp.]
MATRRSNQQGLNSEDVAALRQQLADGRRPRVTVAGPQFPAGSTGTVSRIGEPDADGADYVTVRVKVNGLTDELAFAPAELSRGRTGSRSAPAAAPKPAKRATSTTRSGSPPDPSRPSGPAHSKAARSRPTQSSPARSSPARSSAAPAVAAPATAVPALASAPAAPGLTIAPPPATAPSRRRKATALAKVSFTVTASGASWSLSATRGAKSVLKNLDLPPGTVTALAELLGQPALIEAVAEINDTALSAAQLRAEQLRAELDALEAVLATHRSPR